MASTSFRPLEAVQKYCEAENNYCFYWCHQYRLLGLNEEEVAICLYLKLCVLVGAGDEHQV